MSGCGKPGETGSGPQGTENDDETQMPNPEDEAAFQAWLAQQRQGTVS
jgi:hypothetical protein